MHILRIYKDSIFVVQIFGLSLHLIRMLCLRQAVNIISIILFIQVIIFV